jgi:acetate kinase
VTHGGLRFTAPVLVDGDVLAALEEATWLAPLHNPPQVAAIRRLARRYPGVPQVACFDTAFHAAMPRVERLFGLPRALFAEGIARYGFHGLSYEYIASVLPRYAGAAADGRVVVAHLGHGGSLCAMRERRSVATTMSFTPLDGLPMATRSGAIDPGVLLHLLRDGRMSVPELHRLLWEQSGLLGVSGLSDDLRVLLESDRPEAAESIGYYVYRVVREIGAMIAVLGGLDVLVFTGGVGEGSPEIRRRVMESLAWIGLTLDDGENKRGGPLLSVARGRPAAFVIPTNEELVVARNTFRLVSPCARSAASLG